MICKNGGLNTIFQPHKNKYLGLGVQNLDHQNLQGNLSLNQKVDRAQNLDQDAAEFKIQFEWNWVFKLNI